MAEQIIRTPSSGRPVKLARLSPLRRGFLLGYRRGFSQALAKMSCKADQWEAKIGELQEDYQALVNELRCVRDARAIERALIERTTQALLH
jgi:hypothetical protein